MREPPRRRVRTPHRTLLPPLCIAIAALATVPAVPAARTPAADAPGSATSTVPADPRPAGGLRAQEPGVREPGGSPGTVRTALLLRELRGAKRVLVIGAHPDDEDTALLTALARGLGAEAAYLSLTRGEGGQNLIGPELDEGLGLVRTGELLAARALDGGVQFFTRAYDFGYSKDAAETLAHWPRDSLLADVVRVVRTLRPQILVSIFEGSDQDGHGQHQVAGILAREAFDAAGDPSRFPAHLEEGLPAWTPLKLYRRTWRDPEESTLRVPTGRRDPVLGRSHHQLAMASRSRHRSQDFGTAQHPGPRSTELGLLESRVAGPDTSLFAGVDTTLTGLAAELPAGVREPVLRELRAYLAAVDTAAADLAALAPEKAAPALAAAVTRLRRAVEAAGEAEPHLAWVLGRKLDAARRALLSAAGISLELRSAEATVVPGQRLTVTADLWNGGPFPVAAEPPELRAPEGWEVSAPEAVPTPPEVWFGPPRPVEAEPPPEPGTPLAPGELRRWRFEVRVAADAEPSTPYFLRRERAGDLYRWPEDPRLRARPTDPPLVEGSAALRLEPEALDVRLEARAAARYRGVDKASGEFWRPLLVLPAVSVAVEPRVLVWPSDDPGPRELRVRLRSEAPDPVEAAVRLDLPAGWEANPAEEEVELPEPGATRSLAFRLRAPSGPEGEVDRHRIRARAVGRDGRRWEREAIVVDYPHIDPAVLLRPATVALRRFPVRVAERRVGYVPGSGDEALEAMRQLGVDAETVSPAELEEGALDRFDVIVLGVRAYEVRADLAAANDRLLAWVRRGGTLIVQYNKYEFEEGGFAPYPVCMDRPHGRVTDETAPVEPLHPEAPVFTTPNRIGPEDFEGWVQERGLYFLGDWDPRYTPLLAVADPGEAPQRGALLVTTLGEGLYVYTGLAFFRQLPEGVPGAYRLLANLLSLDPEAWGAFLRESGAVAAGPAARAQGGDGAVAAGEPAAEVSCTSWRR